MEKEQLKKTVLVAGAMIGGWSLCVTVLLLLMTIIGGSSGAPTPKKPDDKAKPVVTGKEPEKGKEAPK